MVAEMSNPQQDAYLVPQMEAAERQGASRRILPFSPYQALLFIVDFAIGTGTFWLVLHETAEGVGLNRRETLSYCIIMAGVMLSFFPAYGLYSYHMLFRRSLHLKGLAKSICWALLMMGVMLVTYNWPFLLMQDVAFKAGLLFVGALALAVLARFISSHIGKFIAAVGLSFIAIAVSTFILGETISPLVLLRWQLPLAMLCGAAVIGMARCLIVEVIYGKLLRRHFRRQVLIVGLDQEAEQVTRHIIEMNAPFWVAGVVSMNGGVQSEVKAGEVSKACLGNFKDLPLIVEEVKVQDIIVTEKEIDKRALISLLDYCLAQGIVAWFPPPLLPIIPLKIRLDQFCGIPMVRLCAQRTPGLFRALKRAMDLVLTILLLVALSPLFAVIAVAIKLDSEGPVFYKAEAVGKGGRRFKMLKFRSMRVVKGFNPHKEFVEKFIKGQVPEENKKKGIIKLTEDPRVTRVGKRLRRLSLDELPQLINVLKGEMSLVGPRPCLPYEYELYKAWHRKRNDVLPGITGLWQVTGRSEVLFEDMILLDLYYIYNRSLLLDISILFETIFVVLAKKGAW